MMKLREKNTFNLADVEFVIMEADGNIMEENLVSAGLDKKWLKDQLNSQNIKDASEVFYAGLDNTKKLYISKKGINNSGSHGKYGIQ